MKNIWKLLRIKSEHIFQKRKYKITGCEIHLNYVFLPTFYITWAEKTMKYYAYLYLKENWKSVS
jgi:hypothetical protein